jgi:hypothetical protein
MRFRRLGRGHHPVIATAADLREVIDLEDAHWVATAAPVATLRGDAGLYARLDRDGDGRIRSDDLREGVRWLFEHTSDDEAVEQGLTVLRPERLRAEGPEYDVLTGALQIVGDPSLQAVRARIAEEEAKGLSSAGRVPASAAEGEVQQLLAAVVKATDGVEHPSGERAVDADTLAAYRAQRAEWLDWHAEGEGDEVRVAGADTAAAAAAVEAIEDKVDQFFLLCDAVQLDPRLAEAARVAVPDDAALLDPEVAEEVLRTAPLSPPSTSHALRVDAPINPLFREAVHRLFREAVRPLLGERDELGPDEWNALKAKLAPYRAWAARRPALADAGLDVAEVRARSADAFTGAEQLLARSEEEAKKVDGLRTLERLLLYQAHLLRLANNFVAMPELMSADVKGLMEQGRLVMDGRVFDLALRVTDAARAETFGKLSPIFVLYVRLGAVAGEWTDEVAVPVTAGERGHLVEGKWGVFHPVDGPVVHAQVRAIASSPISIWEAIMAPFRTVSATVQAAADQAAAEQSTEMKGKIDGATWSSQVPMLLAGGGIAVAGLGTALATLTGVFTDATTGVAGWLAGLGLPEGAAGPLGVLVVFLGVFVVPFVVYAVPVAFATWLRLRQRDLGSVLEGAGWAVNERLMLERGHAVRLTSRPTVP